MPDDPQTSIVAEWTPQSSSPACVLNGQCDEVEIVNYH
jgi:hypothetical protein